MTSTTQARPNRVGTALRDMRLRAGLGGIEAGRRSGISQSKISKLERGRLLPRPEDIITLCSLYGATPEEREQLVAMAAEIREESRRSRVVLSRGGASSLQRRIGRIEADATSFRVFEPTLVIGLLQTAAYARCVFGAELRGDDLEDAIQARLDRAAVLGDTSRQFTLIMTEGALRWQAGGPSVMAEQIDAIAQASRRRNVRLGVIPWTTPVDVFPRHGWWIYDSSLVMIGTEIAAGTHTDPEDIAVYDRLFSQLTALASFGADARRELARIGSDYRLLA